MKLVMDISVTSRPLRVGRAFDPGALFAGGVAGGAYIAAQSDTVFSDQAGQVPAQIGQSAARVDDSGANLQHMIQPSSALRPLLGRAPVDAAPGGPIDQGSGPSFLRFDLSDDAMGTTFADGGTFDVMVFGRQGSWIERDVAIAAGASLNIGPRSFAGAPQGVLAALGDIVGWVAVGRTLIPGEVTRLLRYFGGYGAKGLLVPQGDVITNGDFADGTANWEPSPSETVLTASNGALTVTIGAEHAVSSTARTSQEVVVDPDTWYLFEAESLDFSGPGIRYGVGVTGVGTAERGMMESPVFTHTGDFRAVFKSSGALAYPRLFCWSNQAGSGHFATFAGVSLRKLEAV